MRYKNLEKKDFLNQIETERAYFNEIKSNGLDPQGTLESYFEDLLPEKVGRLLNNLQIAEIIKSCDSTKERVVFIKEIIDKLLEYYKDSSTLSKLDLCLRVATAVYTEGVVTAPIDGIKTIEITQDQAVKLEFAGPIRAAGGTGCAIIVMLAEYLRKKFDLKAHRPKEEQVERFISEALQYIKKHPTQIRPSKEQIEFVIRNCPIMIDGVQTEKQEVLVHKFITNIAKPRIRGPGVLVVVEGFIVRCKKLFKYLKTLDLEWDWLYSLSTLGEKYRKIAGARTTSDSKYSLSIGRPVISESTSLKGLSIRIGTTPTTQIAGTNVHPKLLNLLRFVNLGSQLVVSLPGKATTITGVCEDLRAPLVLYKEGLKEYIYDTYNQVLKIVDPGEILISAGDFVEFNKTLPPRDYCNGCFRHDTNYEVDLDLLTEEELFKLELKYPKVKIPPKFSLSLDALNYAEYLKLRTLDLEKITKEHPDFSFYVDSLLKLGAPYDLVNQKPCLKYGKVFEYYMGRTLDLNYFEYLELKETFVSKGSGLVEYLNSKLESKIKLGERGLLIITARVGRAESVNMTKLKPKESHSLCEYNPLGGKGTFWNNILKKPTQKCKFNLRYCFTCKEESVYRKCFKGHETQVVTYCETCKLYFKDILETHLEHKCYTKKEIVRNYLQEFRSVEQLLKSTLSINQSKNLKTLSSKTMAYPEALLKGFLRSYFDLPVSKDGTFRISATNLSTTHFTARQIHTSLEDLYELGYTKDLEGKLLDSLDQIIPLKLNDVIVPEVSIKILLKASKFIDLLLIHYYKTEPYYEAQSFKDLLGVSIYSISPHTSNAPLGRIIGYTKNLGLYCHPIMVVNRRRDTDGDSDTFGLITDLYLNGSKEYVQHKSGALMSVPLNLTRNFYLDEVGMEILGRELYQDYYKGLLNNNLKAYPVEFLKTLSRVGNQNSKYLSEEKYLFNTPGFKLNTESIQNMYKDAQSNSEKIDMVLKLQNLLPGIDQTDCIVGLIEGHLIPDIIGNMNAYFRQDLKCDHCSYVYHVEPLNLTCYNCKIGTLKFTVYPGMVQKYVPLILKLKGLVKLPSALDQRIRNLLNTLNSIFNHHKSTLASFLEKFKT